MSTRAALLRLYHYPANIFSWTAFAFVGVALNVACALLLLVPGRQRFAPLVRGTIRRLFGGWCAWLRLTRLVPVRFHGFTPGALAGPAVYVANHPGLLDATFLLSRLPDTICIFKRAIIRNPVLGPAALLAGYATGEHGVDVIRDVAQRVAGGRSLLIFPEGTRTLRDTSLNPLKPGFALIAARARVPVRVIVIRAPRDLVPKGWPWWRAPAFPAEVDVTLLGEVRPQEDEDAVTLTARVAQQLSAALAAP